VIIWRGNVIVLHTAQPLNSKSRVEIIPASSTDICLLRNSVVSSILKRYKVPSVAEINMKTTKQKDK
jgi:hypothetical protein